MSLRRRIEMMEKAVCSGSTSSLTGWYEPANLEDASPSLLKQVCEAAATTVAHSQIFLTVQEVQ